MRRRFGTAIACGVIAAALTLAAPGLAGFKSGTYSGTTSQLDSGGDPYPLLLEVNRKKTKVRGFVEGDRGESPCDPPIEFHVDTKVKPSGKFNHVDEFGYGYVKGKFEGKKASGTARFTFEPNGCDSGVITWDGRKSS
jgi:hypothetical protein